MQEDGVETDRLVLVVMNNGASLPSWHLGAGFNHHGRRADLFRPALSLLKSTL